MSLREPRSWAPRPTCRGVQKAPEPGALCCVRERSLQTARTYPRPLTLSKNNSASVLLLSSENKFIHFPGSCLPACLCIHGLFTCRLKLPLLVTSRTGGGLNEPKAAMADVPQDSGARGCLAGDLRPPLCRQSLDLSLKAGWILPPRRGAGRPGRDVSSGGG